MTIARLTLISRQPEIGTAFERMRRVAVAVRTVRAGGQFPGLLSGNCNSAVGTHSALTPARRAIFWFDAHGDCNTPDTTTTGFLDGMDLYQMPPPVQSECTKFMLA
jgi:arginase